MEKPHYLISTPENVDLHLELAGLGNRIMAAAVDVLCILTINCALITFLILLVVAAETASTDADLKNIVYFWAAAIGLLLLFVITFGYFIYFEGTWQGQTPGKRFLGIRVVESDGQPISWGAVLIRNLFRVIDQTPGLFLGIIAMLVDRNERRLGDLAAGTLVIRERASDLLTRTGDLHFVSSSSTTTTLDSGQISPDEYNLIVSFLNRRDMMMPSHRQVLANDLAAHFKTKLGAPTLSGSGEQLLETVFLTYRQRTTGTPD